MNRALSEGIEGFSAINSYGPDNAQLVVILAEGDDESIQEYSGVIKEQFPPHAEVSSIEIEPYAKRVVRILDYMHLIQVEQLEEEIPAILSIKSTQEKMVDQQDQMLQKQDHTTDEIRALRTDLKTEMNERFNKIEMELQMMKDALHRSGILA